MNVKAHSSVLAQAAKDLNAAWLDARASWRDAQAAEFQQTYLDPLPAQIAKSREALEELDRFLRKVRTECE